MENLLHTLAGELLRLGPTDALTIATLAALEGLLSVDNALVLAILVRDLPPLQRRRALTYGIVGAFLFRFVALVLAAWLMRLVVFKLIGGAYLVYLAMKHMFFFYRQDAHQPRPATASSFWKTVLLVELTDIAFSIDSITTAVAMTDKIAVVWVGGVLGIIALRFAAGLFVRLLERLPKLEDLAYQLIFFIGAKLVLEGFHVEIGHATFWLVMGLIAVLGASLVFRDWYQRRSHTAFTDRLLERLQRGEVSATELESLAALPLAVVRHLLHHGWPDAAAATGDTLETRPSP